MEIKELKINNYSSILTEQSLTFSNQIITLIGRNGAGKSNVLSAVLDFFMNPDYRMQNKEQMANYKASVLLSNKDIQDFYPIIKPNKNTHYVDVFFDLGEPRVKRLYSRPTSIVITQYKKELNDIKQKVIELIDEYIVELIALDVGDVTFNSQKIENIVSIDDKNLWNQQDKLNRIIGTLKNEQKKIETFIDNRFKDDQIIIDRYDRGNYWFYGLKDFKVEINIRDIKLSKLEQAHITIDFEGLKKEIESINKKLKKLTDAIEENYNAFADKIKSIYNILEKKEENYYQKHNAEKAKANSFIDKVRFLLEKEIYFLDNENSLIFGENINRNRNKRYASINNPIFYSFLNHCKKQGIISKEIKELKLDELETEKQNEIRDELVKFIKTNIPKFDNDLIKDVDIEITNNGFEMFIIEQDNKRINFNETSLGRRWYFTYFFIKKCLSKGDYFLIDEPASFLHPGAQKTILSELEALVKQGIHVVISTHSPYMISSNLSSYFLVEMTESGTVMTEKKIINIKDVHEEIGTYEINDLLLNSDKKIVLVEGKTDKACLETFINLFEINNSEYFVFDIHGHGNHTLIRKLLDSIKSNYVQLMDIDAKKFHESENNIIYVGENTPEKSIEGLFSEKDQKKYTQFIEATKKVKIKTCKIREATLDTLDPETINNFRKLFNDLGINKKVLL